MNDSFVQNALNMGEKGAQWLKSIPDLIAEFQNRWDITVGAPFDLSYNYVAPATLSNGDQAVIKIGCPDGREFRTEMDALRVYGGDGMVKLYETDEDHTVMLLERVQPGIPLSDIQDDDAATRILAAAMKKLRLPTPANYQFPHISDWASAIQRLKQNFNASTGPLPDCLVNKAEELFEELIGSITEPIVAHGDLHHDNVLKSDNGRWIVIDPKGIIAEPAYETAAMLRNPNSKLVRTGNLTALFKHRIILLSEELEIDPIRIHKWAIAQTVLSSVWTVEDGGVVTDFEIRTAEAMNGLVI